MTAFDYANRAYAVKFLLLAIFVVGCALHKNHRRGRWFCSFQPTASASSEVNPTDTVGGLFISLDLMPQPARIVPGVNNPPTTLVVFRSDYQESSRS
jgi:hypothetical protein